MRVWVKPDVLARLGLTVDGRAERAVSAQNTVNPAGQVGAEPAPPGQEFTYTVRAQGRLVHPEEFGDVVVRANPDGSLVRVRDVARIELGSRTTPSSAASTASPAGVVAAFQLRARTRSTSRGGRASGWRDLKTRFPAGIDYEISLDTTAPVKAGIEEILITLLEAIGLVIAGRLHLPAELAGDADPAAHRAGVAGRRVRPVPVPRLLDQHAVAVWAGAGRLASSSTTPSWSWRRSSTISRRACRRATRRSRRCTRCRHRSSALP